MSVLNRLPQLGELDEKEYQRIMGHAVMLVRHCENAGEVLHDVQQLVADGYDFDSKTGGFYKAAPNKTERLYVMPDGSMLDQDEVQETANDQSSFATLDILGY